MKNRRIKFYLLVFILINSGWMNAGWAQVKLSTEETALLIEKTKLITDRETYCVNEDLHFSAWNISSPALRNAGWSNVLYVELVSPDGESFVREKLNYTKDGAYGTLHIPQSMLTGNYYLRAYTRWMRDYSPYHYFYKMVTIINPYRAELMEPAEKSQVKNDAVLAPLNTNGGFQIKAVKTDFAKREQATVEISAENRGEISGKCIVSVISKGTEKGFIPEFNGTQNLKFSPDFIPETRGLSISGTVVNEADSVPLPYTLVGLTIFTEHPETRNIMTNDKGQFFFDLSTLNGEYEIFISAKSKEGQNPRILVDNDFSSQSLKLPWVPVDLSSERKMLYQSMIFNSQMQTLYRQQKAVDEMKSFSSDSAFYGKPDFVLKMADYIPLSTVKDYFYELIPQVGVRKEGRKSVLKVLGIYSELGIYDPLIMVDMVPIFDVDRVLAIQPGKLDRIEVVTSPYIRGDIIYGGVVSLFSKNGDLAGIDLPSAGRFITYGMLSADSISVTPSTENKRIPDLQNCLYWNPDLKVESTTPVKISFSTGDNSGAYLIVVRGFDKNGLEKISTAEISVR